MDSLQCPVCRFENMPGQPVCARCRAKLTADAIRASAGRFEPPRAGGLKALRPVAYGWTRFVDRHFSAVPVAWSRFAPEMHDVPPAARAAMVGSIIPGAGHLYSGRRRTGALLFLAWLVCALLVVQYFLCLGWWFLCTCLVSCHALAVYDAGRISQYAADHRRRLRLMMWIYSLVFGAYLGGGIILYRATDARFIRVQGAMDGAGLQAGDLLVCRNLVPPERPRLGDVITAEFVRQGQTRLPNAPGPVYYGHYQAQSTGTVPLWVVALPGETVILGPHGLSVGARVRVPGRDLPQPGIALPQQPVGITVPPDYIMALYPLARGYEAAPIHREVIWRDLYLIRLAEVRARARAVYQPSARRGWLPRRTIE